MRVKQNLYTIGEVARILEVQPYKIVYLINTGQVPEPAIRLGGRRAFTIEDMAGIAEKMSIQLGQQLGGRDGRRANET